MLHNPDNTHVSCVCLCFAYAVLTSDGCISFVDLQARVITGQLQLTVPGCRALEFSTDPRANTMAVVCSDGMLRLYDLGVVRAQQQRHSQAAQQRLQELKLQELKQLSTSAEVFPSSAQGTATGSRSRVLSDVGNVERSSGGGRGSAGKVKGPSRPPAAGSSTGITASGQLQVRSLSGSAAEFNTHKLRDMLLVCGQFPARYRRLIW